MTGGKGVVLCLWAKVLSLAGVLERGVYFSKAIGKKVDLLELREALQAIQEA